MDSGTDGVTGESGAHGRGDRWGGLQLGFCPCKHSEHLKSETSFTPCSIDEFIRQRGGDSGGAAAPYYRGVDDGGRGKRPRGVVPSQTLTWEKTWFVFHHTKG